MLIVSRREDETLILQTSDGDIVVSVEPLRGSQVKIGIDASESVKVFREELLDRDAVD